MRTHEKKKDVAHLTAEFGWCDFCVSRYHLQRLLFHLPKFLQVVLHNPRLHFCVCLVGLNTGVFIASASNRV